MSHSLKTLMQAKLDNTQNKPNFSVAKRKPIGFRSPELENIALTATNQKQPDNKRLSTDYQWKITLMCLKF